MAEHREPQYDPYIPSGGAAGAGAAGSQQAGGNQRTAALQAVSIYHIPTSLLYELFVGLSLDGEFCFVFLSSLCIMILRPTDRPNNAHTDRNNLQKKYNIARNHDEE